MTLQTSCGALRHKERVTLKCLVALKGFRIRLVIQHLLLRSYPLKAVLSRQKITFKINQKYAKKISHVDNKSTDYNDSILRHQYMSVIFKMLI